MSASPLAAGLNRSLDRLRQLQTSSNGAPTFKWKNVDVPCVGNTYSRRTVLEVGGIQVEADATLFVKKSEFLTMDSTLMTMDSTLVTMDSNKPRPVAGLTLIYAGITMRVETVHDPFPWDPESTLTLALLDPSK